MLPVIQIQSINTKTTALFIRPRYKHLVQIDSSMTATPTWKMKNLHGLLLSIEENSVITMKEAFHCKCNLKEVILSVLIRIFVQIRILFCK